MWSSCYYHPHVPLVCLVVAMLLLTCTSDMPCTVPQLIINGLANALVIVWPCSGHALAIFSPRCCHSLRSIEIIMFYNVLMQWPCPHCVRAWLPCWCHGAEILLPCYSQAIMMPASCYYRLAGTRLWPYYCNVIWTRYLSCYLQYLCSCSTCLASSQGSFCIACLLHQMASWQHPATSQGWCGRRAMLWTAFGCGWVHTHARYE